MIINFTEKYEKDIVLSLGFFDSLHLGHRELINKTKELAKKTNSESAVFTFTKGFNKKQIYTLDERLELLKEIKIDRVILANPTEEFLNLEAKDFLDKLIKNYKIKYVVCGSDYRYGKNASGDINFLKKYLEKFGIYVYVVDMVLDNGTKISSTVVKKLIEKGDINSINKLLLKPYRINGKVIKGRGEGRKLGFPTLNINLPENKVKLKEGVYKTSIKLNDKVYSSLTNVGAKPTFKEMGYNFETFLIDYNGESLYDKCITIYFHQRIRDVIKFKNKNELITQIQKDLKEIK